MNLDVVAFSNIVLAVLFLFMAFEYDEIEPEYWVYSSASVVMVITGLVGLIVAGVR